MEILSSPILWIVVAALSEIIGMTPRLRENSILQLAMKAVYALKPVKKP